MCNSRLLERKTELKRIIFLLVVDGWECFPALPLNFVAPSRAPSSVLHASCALVKKTTATQLSCQNLNLVVINKFKFKF